MKKKSSFKFIATVLVVFMSSIILLAGCGEKVPNVYVDGISISKKNLYLAEGQTAVISAQVFPFNANNQNYVFESSNNAVVTCEDGFVVAKKAGNAVISVYSEEGGYKDSCNVLVTTAKDNLELNSYNNLNMPPKDLKPIFNSDDYKTDEKTTQTSATLNNTSTFTNSKNNSIFAKMKKYALQKVNAEAQDEIQAGKNVLEDVKQELQNSITNLNSQKNMFTSLFGEEKNTLFDAFNNLQNQIYDEIAQTKQNMIDNISEIKEKIDTGEYTVETKDMNGVTFVVIKNRIENSNLENI